MDFGNAAARIGRAELVLRHGVAEPVLMFALPTDIIVPANSEMAVQLRAKPSKVNSVASNVPLLLEPTSWLTDSGVVLGRSLTTSTHPMALLLNHTDENIPCKRLVIGTLVCEVYPSTQTPINKVSPYDHNPNISLEDPPKELQDLVPVSTLSKDKCALVTKTLIEFQDIFTLPRRDLGRTDSVQYEINVDPQVSQTLINKVSPYDHNPNVTLEDLPKELQNLVPVSTLSKDKCALVKKILNEFQDIFTLLGRDLSRTDAVQYEIHVNPQVSPIRLPKRR